MNIFVRKIQRIVFFLWLCGPTWAMASSFLRFLDHKQRRITVGRTPLGVWSARRRDLYLTTQNTHNRQTSMPPLVFEPTISAGERPQTYALDRAAAGTGIEDNIIETNKGSNVYILLVILTCMSKDERFWKCKIWHYVWETHARKRQSLSYNMSKVLLVVALIRAFPPGLAESIFSSGLTENFVRERVQRIQLRTEDRKKGSLGAVVL